MHKRFFRTLPTTQYTEERNYKNQNMKNALSPFNFLKMDNFNLKKYTLNHCNSLQELRYPEKYSYKKG